MARLALLTLTLGSWLAGARRASGGPPPDDGVPKGAVAFVAGGACPAGWKPAAEVEGRLVVAVSDGAKAGVLVGKPLDDRENRLHAHTYSGSVSLPEKDLTAPGGGNNDGAHATAYPVSGTTQAFVTSLPFVQVQACVKP